MVLPPAERPTLKHPGRGMVYRLGLALAFVFLLAAVDPGRSFAKDVATGYTIAGRAVLSGTGEPIPDVAATLITPSRPTWAMGGPGAADGSFRITGIKRGHYVLRLSASGFRRFVLPLVVRDNLNLGTLEMEPDSIYPLSKSIRAVLLTDSGSVLLMKIAGRRGELWITPGGRVEEGESPESTLSREIEEETGRAGVLPGAEIWIRHASFDVDGIPRPEQERFFLVPTERFDPVTFRMEVPERAVFREFRWWPIEEVARSSERFAPRRLGELLLALRSDGPPAPPIETGE